MIMFAAWMPFQASYMCWLDLVIYAITFTKYMLKMADIYLVSETDAVFTDPNTPMDVTPVVGFETSGLAAEPRVEMLVPEDESYL